jgi:hypothetical protein
MSAIVFINKSGLKSVKLVTFITLIFFVSKISNAQSINSGFVGQNYWMASFSFNGKLEKTWNKIREMHPEVIRVGGDYYHKYIGVQKYSQLLDSIYIIGAEPIIQISNKWSAIQVSELLHNFVISKRNLKYFYIGNEIDMGNPNINVNDVISFYLKIGDTIRNYFPNAILGGPSYANFWGGVITSLYIPFIDGTVNAKDSNGKYLLNVFDFHTYNTSFNESGSGIFDLSNFSTKITPLLNKIIEVNKTRPKNDQLSWSVSEFHTTYDNKLINVGGKKYPVPETHKTWSFYAGQYFAQMYAFGKKNNAFAMIPWSIHESSGERSEKDLGIFDDTISFKPRSTYYHTQMIGQNLKKNYIANSTNKSDVQVLSMSDSTGVTVMVMNTGIGKYDMTLKLNMNNVSDNNLVVLTNAGINNELKTSIEATSTITFVFNAKGDLLKKNIYSKINADKNEPPTLYLSEKL